MNKSKAAALLLAGALGGAGTTLAVLRAKPELAFRFAGKSAREFRAESDMRSALEDQKSLFRSFDQVFDDDFFRQENPFAEMRKFREYFDKQFPYKNRDAFSSSPFDSWFGDRFGGGSVADIEQKEDDSSIHYEVRLHGVDVGSVRTKVEDGQLTITGELTRESEGQKGDPAVLYKSSFTRSFPLPENVDADKMEIANEKDKLVLTFPKRNKLPGSA